MLSQYEQIYTMCVGSWLSHCVSSAAQTTRQGSHWGEGGGSSWHIFDTHCTPAPKYRQITHRLSQLITQEFRVRMTSTHESCDPIKGTTRPCGRKTRFCKSKVCQLTYLEIVTVEDCLGEIQTCIICQLFVLKYSFSSTWVSTLQKLSVTRIIYVTQGPLCDIPSKSSSLIPRIL